MLAVVKEPHTEIALNGRGAKEMLNLIRQKYTVQVIEDSEECEESIPIEDTDFWREMQSNRVGRLLRGGRLRADMTQKQLAEKCGVKQNMISDYEKGNRNLTKDMAKKFAKVLKVNSKYFDE